VPGDGAHQSRFDDRTQRVSLADPRLRTGRTEVGRVASGHRELAQLVLERFEVGPDQSRRLDPLETELAADLLEQLAAQLGDLAAQRGDLAGHRRLNLAAQHVFEAGLVRAPRGSFVGPLEGRDTPQFQRSDRSRMRVRQIVVFAVMTEAAAAEHRERAQQQPPQTGQHTEFDPLDRGRARHDQPDTHRTQRDGEGEPHSA
jgi:hypothetical protein